MSLSSPPPAAVARPLADRLAPPLLGLGLAATAVLTLLDRGATRVWSSPWQLFLFLACALPPAALAFRAVSRTQPLQLPARPWTLLTLAAGLVVSLSACLSPYPDPAFRLAAPLLAALAVFLLIHDWLARDPFPRSWLLLRVAGGFFLAVAVSSLVRWIFADLIPSGAWRHITALIDHRNAEPLGHSNYTAGLALLMLPVFIALAAHSDRLARAGWSFATLLALALLFSSGSRGGLVGLGAVALLIVFHLRLSWLKLLLALLGGAALVFTLAFLHPRTRAMMMSRPPAAAAPNISNVQRSAMLHAGLALGADRPLLGWGPGTTPLAYPRYRAQLEGGAENVLQLHSLPLQLWADLGAAGLLAAAAFLVLAARATIILRGDPLAATASAALAGYLVFALTDAQLDVPVFPVVLAAFAALLAQRSAPSIQLSALSSQPSTPPLSTLNPQLSTLLLPALSALLLALAFARPDSTPRLNTRALTLARDPAQADAAIALLRDSLRLNPAQELAHFNLGWLLVTRDPAAAETHFLAAAQLVPDKGGVYFGLGLARLNQRHRAAAARALALECVNDPAFLASPWWREPHLAALRPEVTAEALRLLATVRPHLVARQTPAAAYQLRELDFLAALLPWLDGTQPIGRVLAAASTRERVAYFAARPERPDFSTDRVQLSHRERTGYPVLMRNLDLPTPIDVFAVQENPRATGELSFLFAPKGWLPTPLLLPLLDAPTPPPAAPPSPLAPRL